MLHGCIFINLGAVFGTSRELTCSDSILWKTPLYLCFLTRSTRSLSLSRGIKATGKRCSVSTLLLHLSCNLFLAVKNSNDLCMINKVKRFREEAITLFYTLINHTLRKACLCQAKTYDPILI